MAETNFLHEELLQEEGMSIRELPLELQKQIKGFNIQKKQCQENPNERDENRLIRLSSQLANNIQNFIEHQDEVNEEANTIEIATKTSKTKQSEKEPNVEKNRVIEKQRSNPNNESKTEINLAPKKPLTTGVSFGNFIMEKKIKSICESNRGRIKITQLIEIIKKEPEYPEQKVHNIKLRKVFLSSDYRIL